MHPFKSIIRQALICLIIIIPCQAASPKSPPAPTAEYQTAISIPNNSHSWNHFVSSAITAAADYHHVWKTAAAAALVIVLLLLRSWEINRRKEQLRISEERYHLAMDAVSETVWEWNLQTGERYFSSGFFSHIGYTKEEIPQNDTQWRELLHPDDCKQIYDEIDKDITSATGKQSSLALQYRIRSKSGEYIHIQSHGSVVKRDANGNGLLRRGTIRDISEEKNAQEQFKTLINTLPIAIVVVNRSGKIIFDNPQAGREIGDNKSLVGRSSLEFYENAEDRKQVLEIIVGRGEVIGRHVKYRINSRETIDCLLSVIPIRFDDQDVLMAATVNVTERIKMEQALAQAKIQAEKADHLKSAFIAGMSHELRTPLNSIIGFTGILLQGLSGPLNDEQKKQLSMVQNSSRHLLALINDVLDISKIEAGKLEISCEEFNLQESIEKVIQTVKPMALEQGLSLKVDISPEVGQMNSDQRRVEQILLNLLSNAIKFTDKGEVGVYCRIEENLVITKVKDTGSGIKPQDMDKLFQTFQQINTGLNRIHEGSGLGLPISKKLVEKLGGDLQVQSVWETGSTFTFRLPLNVSESTAVR